MSPDTLSMRLGVLACLVGITLACAGCSNDPDYPVALKNGRTTIPWVVAFDRLYPGSNHFITHYNIKGADRAWNSEAFLYDRYVVRMQIIGVKFDSSDTRVMSWGTPQFFITEITKVTNTDENKSFQTGQGIQFGPDEWKVLEAAKGDIGALGITVDKHAPVPGFDFIKNQNRG